MYSHAGFFPRSFRHSLSSLLLFPPLLLHPAGSTMGSLAQAGPIMDWVIEYSPQPCIWVCTKEAW